MSVETEIAEIKNDLEKLRARFESVMKKAGQPKSRDPKPQTRKPNLTTR